MGLAEKRIQQEFESKTIPDTLKYHSEQTQGAMGQIKVAVDWASFEDDKAAYDNLSSVWAQPLQGIQEICGDDMGREAVKKSVQKIIIRNVKGKSSVEFKAGVLTASMNLREGTSGSLGWSAYQQAVEGSL